MSFRGNPVTNRKAFDLNSTIDNFAVKLVADSHWYWSRFAGPVVPLEDMYIRAADGGAPNFDQYIVVADARLFDIFEPKNTRRPKRFKR